LPAGAGLVYADWHGVYVVDQSGTRRVAQREGAAIPQISPDGRMLAYRIMGSESSEIWVVNWDGSEPRKVLSEADLPGEGLAPGSGPRQLAQQDIRWLPGSRKLVIRTMAAGLGRDELWHLDVDSGSLERVMELGPAGQFLYAPNGEFVAVLERGNADQPQGNLSIYRADGSRERRALEFRANEHGYGFETQMSWLPNSSDLWTAIVDPETALDAIKAELTLYRVSAAGVAERAGQVQASSVFWSPDGRRLAYTRPMTETFEVMDLVLANADGSDPQTYTTIRYGSFGGWSPDGGHFLFQQEGRVYLGAPGRPPQLVPGLLEASAHWLSPDLFVYPSHQAEDVAIVAQKIGSKPVTIARWPKDMTYDTRRSR
jgi:Tol biopolymer transport system component